MSNETQYEMLVRAKWSIDGAKTLSEAADKLEALAKELREMEADGLQLDGEIQDDYGSIYTTNKELAEKYEMTAIPSEDE